MTIHPLMILNLPYSFEESSLGSIDMSCQQYYSVLPTFSQPPWHHLLSQPIPALSLIGIA